MFRDRFLVTLVLAAPVVGSNPMIGMWLGIVPPSWSAWVPPVLVIFFWGGWPSLSGAVSEIRGRTPGMMLLIGLAVTVAYGPAWRARWAWGAWTSGGSPPSSS